MTASQLALALHTAKGIGPKTVTSIVEKYGSLEVLVEQFTSVRLPEKLRTVILSNIEQAKRIEQDLERRKVSFVYRGGSGYPSILETVPDPPTIIMYRGNLDCLNMPAVAVVGSRRIQLESRSLTKAVVREVVSCGYSVVSGMAFGVDAEAHRACLDNKGTTIAVLATSADVPSPQGNVSLYNKILDNNGLIISETLPSQELHNSYFVKRNRIIAGLCSHTILVQAGLDSGAVHTANIAFSYDRDVFCFSGRVTDEHMLGNNNLIARNTAQLLVSPESIKDYLVTDSSQLEDKKNQVVEIDLTQAERQIYNAVRKAGRTSLESLCAIIQIDVAEILKIISGLEMNGHIVQNEAAQYEIRL